MNIQMSVNYAVKIINYLHQQEGTLKTGVEISKSISMPYRRFTMIASQLSKSGLIDSVRGKSGGHYLAKPIDQINLIDIFFALQGDVQTNHCFQKNQHCTIEKLKKCDEMGIICSLQVSLSAHIQREATSKLWGNDEATKQLERRESKALYPIEER